MVFESTLLTMVQLLTQNSMQGRLQGIYSLVFGFTWLGGFLLGSIATFSNVSIAVGSAGVAVFLVALFSWRSLSQVGSTN